MPERTKGHLDEVIARPRLVEQGAEQHEQEHEFGGNAKRNAKHPFGCDPHMAHRLAQAGTGPANLVGHHFGRAEEHIGQKDNRQRDHDGAKHAIGRDEQHDQPRQCEIRVTCIGQTTVGYDFGVKEIAVKRKKCAAKAKHPVIPGDIVARARPEQWIGHCRKEHREGQMNLAGIVDQVAGQDIGRHGRGQKHLEYGPDQRNSSHKQANTANRATRAAIAGGDQFLKLFFTQRAFF